MAGLKMKIEEDYDDIISLVVEFMLFLIKFKFVYLGPVHTCFRTGSLEYFPWFFSWFIRL